MHARLPARMHFARHSSLAGKHGRSRGCDQTGFNLQDIIVLKRAYCCQRDDNTAQAKACSHIFVSERMLMAHIWQRLACHREVCVLHNCERSNSGQPHVSVPADSVPNLLDSSRSQHVRNVASVAMLKSCAFGQDPSVAAPSTHLKNL
jgi:hypothetical protein